MTVGSPQVRPPARTLVFDTRRPGDRGRLERAGHHGDERLERRRRRLSRAATRQTVDGTDVRHRRTDGTTIVGLGSGGQRHDRVAVSIRGRVAGRRASAAPATPVAVRSARRRRSGGSASSTSLHEAAKSSAGGSVARDRPGWAGRGRMAGRASAPGRRVLVGRHRAPTAPPTPSRSSPSRTAAIPRRSCRWPRTARSTTRQSSSPRPSRSVRRARHASTPRRGSRQPLSCVSRRSRRAP